MKRTPSIRLNPFARVETIRGAAGQIDGLRIVAPVKGRGLQTTRILRNEDDAFLSRRKTTLSALLDAQSGRDPWLALSDAERDFLERAGLFVAEGNVPAAVSFDPTAAVPGAIDPDRLQRLHENLGRQGVAVQPGVMSGAALAAMRRYYRTLVSEGHAQYGGEGGEPCRWVLHNDPLSNAMHPALVGAVSAIAGQPLKPSFSYVIVYLEGASLEPHRDRPQCQVTAVLQVDFDPEPQREPQPLEPSNPRTFEPSNPRTFEPSNPRSATPWPLMFVRGAERFAVTLALGDLVVFRGTGIEHYREPLTCGRSSTSVAFCFVPEEFEGSLD